MPIGQEDIGAWYKFGFTPLHFQYRNVRKRENMRTSERLRRKIKRELPQIEYIDDVTFYRGYGVADGVKFSWFAYDNVSNRPFLYSYDTMTDCLKHPISAIYTHEYLCSPEGWMIGVK